ncbi:MAG: hypothetical protein OXP08_08505 [bacterium]|nr:hypothetical protein [bacterium]
MEVVVDLTITGIVMTSMTLLVLLAIGVFSPRSEAERPERIAARELARSAERMLASEQCANPTPDDLGGDEATRSECLTAAQAPFPVPLPAPDWTDYSGNSTVVCWMVEPDSLAAALDADGTASLDDPRDLECWYHRSATPAVRQGVIGGDLMVAAHRPVDPAGTADMFVPKKALWNPDPYRVSIVTGRVESIGSSFHSTNDPGIHDVWRCVEGPDPDPESALDTGAVALPQLQERDCAPGEFDATDAATGLRESQGVAAVIVDLCVSMSDAELQLRTPQERLPTTDRPYGQTCTMKTVTVSPGRRS